MRKTNDLYPTYTAGLIIKPIKHLILPGQTVLEPCVGYNHIGKFFLPDLITCDRYRYSGYEADYYMDMTQERSWQRMKRLGIDWVVTNPPFSLAPIILPLAFECAKIGVIFLLRLSYLEPCADRRVWLAQHKHQLSHMVPINPRINYDIEKEGTDSVTSAWFVWQRDYNGLTDIQYHYYGE